MQIQPEAIRHFRLISLPALFGSQGAERRSASEIDTDASAMGSKMQRFATCYASGVSVQGG